MKKGCVISGPDVAYGPLALLSGSFEEKISKAARLGYDGIELMVRDPLVLDWRHIKQTLLSAGLEVPQLVTGELYGADGLCIVTPDEDLYRKTEKRLYSVIDLASYLGAMVNIGRVRGRLDSLGDRSRAWAVAIERLHRLADYAAQKGVKITLEPLNRYETDFILDVTTGLQAIHDIHCENIGLMLDLFHMNIEEPVIEESLRFAGSKVWHIHIADSNRCYPGSGHLDFTDVFKTLSEIGYQGYLSAELFPLPDADTAAQKTIEFLNRMLL